MLTHNDLHPIRIDNEQMTAQERERLYTRIRRASPKVQELLYASTTLELLNNITARFALRPEDTRAITRLVRDSLLSGPTAGQFHTRLASKIKSPHRQHISEILIKQLLAPILTNRAALTSIENMLDLRNI